MDKHDLIWPVKVEKVTEYKYLGIVLEISWLLDTILFYYQEMFVLWEHLRSVFLSKTAVLVSMFCVCAFY